MPIHSDDLQEPGVEPRRQQVPEIPVDGVELGLLAFQFQQQLAHAQDRGGASGRPVEPPEELLARRFRGDAELRQVGGRRICGIRVGRGEHPRRIGRELGQQGREESRFFLVVQFPIQVQGDLGQGHPRRLAPLGQQFLAADDEAPDLESVARDDRCAFLKQIRTCSRMKVGVGLLARQV
jgi:hypothetical protein